MTLFKNGLFKFHSGSISRHKIDCDDLTSEDLYTLVQLVKERFSYKRVIGIPQGGMKFANVLNEFIDLNSNTVLLVDDVLTTGNSMREWRKKIDNEFVAGIVIFAWIQPEDWIYPIFRYALN